MTPNERAYAGAVTYDAADAMGWHHSAWDTKRVLAVSPSMIHASAQWCRYDAAGERILPNNVSYVITQVGGAWGIQARFGVDSGPPKDPRSSVDQALGAWDRLFEAVARRDLPGIEHNARLPFDLVGVGVVTVATMPEDVLSHLSESIVGTRVGDALTLQVGRQGVNLGVALRGRGGETSHVLSLVVLDDQGPRVSAVSVLRGAHLFAD